MIGAVLAAAAAALMLTGMSGIAQRQPEGAEGQNAAGKPGRTLWSARHSDGTLDEWYRDQTWSQAHSGRASATVSTAQAHSGNRSLALTITTPNSPNSGARMFRYAEADRYTEAYYEAWYYFPQRVDIVGQGWMNILQVKTKTGPGTSDPIWILGVRNRFPGGPMYAYLHHWPQPDKADYDQDLLDIQPGEWVKFTLFLRQSSADGAADGRVALWQDDTLLFDFAGVPTRYAGSNQEISFNNYASLTSPRTTTIYIDDLRIWTPAYPDDSAR